ncbi:unnamed protein product [Rhizoctonia solani]|uniref:CHAT domain-containing protein n=1 Tax=Rhizoctonia solani TaxID=456999 RepID=A0A8H3H0L3_9AGAM|nr:unnamed protein product [Rhizoctonia solani]
MADQRAKDKIKGILEKIVYDRKRNEDAPSNASHDVVIRIPTAYWFTKTITKRILHPLVLNSGVHIILSRLWLNRMTQFRRSDQLPDIEKAVWYAIHALALTPDGHPNLPDRHAALGASYTDRYKRLGELTDLENAIESKSRTLTLTPDSHPRLPDRHAALGVSYTDRYRRLGELSDLEKAIGCDSRALALTPDDHPSLPDRHTALGVSYTDRYKRLGKLTDLEKAIECDAYALALTPEGHPNLPDRHAALGISYTHRHKRLGKLSDLENAMEHFSRALSLTPEGHLRLPDRYAALGVSYGTRYQRLGELTNLEKTIECNSRALTLTPEGHPRLPDRHAALGASYGSRYKRLGELTDLENAIESKSRALALTPAGHSNLPDRHVALGASYMDRYKRLGELAGLGNAMDHFSCALELTPDGHPNLPDRHAALGVSYTDRYKRLGKLTDLEKAIECDFRALTLTPDGHPNLPDRHAALGMSYTDRYRRLGELVDLENAIKHFSRALTLTPNCHPRLQDRNAALGVSYSDRYKRLGELADLENAIVYDSRALAIIPEGHPSLPDRHASMGVSYTDRYRRLGELTDLEKAVECHSRALSLTPNGHPRLPDRHAALGMSYTDRYQRLGELVDLEKAIECDSRALTLTPDDHPNLSDRYAALGMSYNYRYKRLGELTDLENAIESKSRALALTPEGHPRLPERHAALGVSYTDRCRRLGELADFEKAVQCDSRALALTPGGHPDLSVRHIRWALSCYLQYHHTQNSSYLETSLCSFREASQLSNGPPRDVFKNALRWTNLASKHSGLDPIEAFRATIDLLPHFIWLGSTTTQRYHDLSSTENLAVRAAFVAILSSEYALALEWLEHARCVVWSQSLMLRSPVDILQASHPDIATQLRSVAGQLHQANSQSSSTRAVTDTPEHRHHLARVYNDLVVQVRTLPGFEDFLLPTKANELVKAARNGPVVVINCEENRCDALLVLPGSTDIKHVHLSGFNGRKAQCTRFEMEKSITNRRPKERGTERRPMQEEEIDFGEVLADLWYGIVKPVLDSLGYRNKDSIAPSNLPHITWCPTGALTFLPLHAAGDYSQPRSRVFDYVVSSYTPTLTALLSSWPSKLDHSSRVLIVGQEATPGHQQLPGTTRELDSVVCHIQGVARHSQLLGEQATITTVLDEMEQHDWVHLACHAHQNIHDPTRSGFFLHDDTLDLTSINQRSLKNKGMAFLSACQTAMGDKQLPDEAIHLASGMLTAGYSSVIATMWSVYDDDAPLVADRVYAQLMKDGGIGNGEAGRALHNAVGELRDKVGEKEYSRWVPYIHIGS